MSSPLALVTVWSKAVPPALKSVTVSVFPPSAFGTVTSVRSWSKLLLPVVSRLVATESPPALVVVTVLSFKEPSALSSAMVTVTPPSALVWVTSVLTAPPWTRRTVTVLPSALVVVAVWS